MPTARKTLEAKLADARKALRLVRSQRDHYVHEAREAKAAIASANVEDKRHIAKLDARIAELIRERESARAEAQRERDACDRAHKVMESTAKERDQLAADLDAANTRLMDVEAALVNVVVRLA